MNQDKIQFSPLIVGTMRLGKWDANMTTAQYEKFMEDCLERGLRDFDHADIYGHYTTEADFGKVLKTRKDLREKIQITTKCGINLITPNRPNIKVQSYDSSRAHILKSVENSLKVLETDYLDLLLIHRPDFLMDPSEIAEAFEKLKTQGKVKHFGVSNFTPIQFDVLNSFFPLETNQVEASITHLDPFEDGTLLQCQKYNSIPTAWSPLGGGTLFGESDDPRVQRIQKIGKELAEIYNAQFDQILLAWLLLHPAGIIPVLGTTKMSRIDAALGALDIRLTQQEWYSLWEASKGEPVP